MKSTLTAQDLQRAICLIRIKGRPMVQEDFASLIGVRPASVSRWINGHIDVPGYVEAWIRDVHPRIYAKVKKEAK